MARKKYRGTIVPGVEPGKGLVCRACGCRHFRVLYTRPGDRNRNIRRRACRHCGLRITTTEQAENADSADGTDETSAAGA